MRESLLHNEHVACAEPKQKKWVARNAIAQPAPFRPFTVLFDGQDADITVSSMVEIAAGNVMPRVRASPKVIRREREDAAEESHQIVSPPAAKKRMMSAVVLDDEYSRQESGSGYGEDQC